MLLGASLPVRCSAPARRALYRRPFKLIQGSSATVQIFDLAHDAGEIHDLFDRSNARAIAEDMLNGQPPLLDWIPRHAMPGADAEAEQRLRALGYVR